MRHSSHRLPVQPTWVMRWVHPTLNIVAALALTSLGYGAAQNVSQAFDVWYYHVPFAARLAGVVGESEFVFSPTNAGRYAGFPLFAELLQGLAYAVTGRPEAVNLVAFFALCAFVFWLCRRFRVPLHQAIMGVLAIPLVQMHASSAYVDLPANLALVASALLLFAPAQRMGRSALGNTSRKREPIIALLLLAAASNMRFQLVPALTALVAVWAYVAWKRAVLPRTLALLPLVYFTPLKNLLLHGNPVYPVELHVLGKTLPFLEPQYSEKPLAFRAVPEPLLWVRSVLEFDLKPLGDPNAAARWSIDQYAPAADPASRMGGFFGVYMFALVLVLWLLWTARAAAGRAKPQWRAAWLAAGATAIAVLSPQAHELRYYLFWALGLVAIALLALRKHPALGSALFASAFVATTWLTEGQWIDYRGKSFAEFVAARAPEASLPELRPDDELCVDRAPFNFLYAARFHTRANHYRVREEQDDAPNPCANAKALKRP